MKTHAIATWTIINTPNGGCKVILHIEPIINKVGVWDRVKTYIKKML